MRPRQSPPHPDQPAAAGDRRRRAWMSALVIGFAVVGVWLTAVTGRRDAAVLFVGLPALLALGIALRPRARSLHGAVATGTTFALLLAAMVLQEGAICVLLAAPLVFAVAHTIAAVTRHVGGRHQAVIVLPLVLLASVEGIVPGWRIAPEQTVEVAATVAAEPAVVMERLAAGPDFADVTPPLLLRTGFPLPGSAHGDGLGTGDRWTFDYHGSEIVTEVTAGTDDHVDFGIVYDDSKTARWLTWDAATLSWEEQPDGTTEVAISITFERGLDPSWWFGPVEDAFVRAGATYLLDALVLDDAGDP